MCDVTHDNGYSFEEWLEELKTCASAQGDTVNADNNDWFGDAEWYDDYKMEVCACEAYHHKFG
ncbi:hypothetical protein HmCmsJML021_01902 [Escherichia coli]|nr:hypothetical protein HmCmsJML021_01902 [Escherichia coli]